jgi:hypothetical protein
LNSIIFKSPGFSRFPVQNLVPIGHGQSRSRFFEKSRSRCNSSSCPATCNSISVSTRAKNFLKACKNNQSERWYIPRVWQDHLDQNKLFQYPFFKKHVLHQMLYEFVPCNRNKSNVCHISKKNFHHHYLNDPLRKGRVRKMRQWNMSQWKMRQ